MTKAVQKITLSPSRDIPFNKLALSQSNVRRVKAGVSIEQLAESIAQRTLLQSLSVRAVVDADGNHTGMFEVPAGGRRYRALELLVKQKRMSKTQAVPCVVREGGIAEDDSVAENDERVGLHPAESWKWIAVAVVFPYGHINGLREIEGEPADLTKEEQAALDALNAEYAKIEEDYQDADELPDEIDQRLGEIEAARSVLEARSLVYDPAEIARAGVFVSIDAEGLLSVARGYARPEDEAPASSSPRTKHKATERPTTDQIPMPLSNVRLSPLAARQPNPSRRRTTTRSSRCRIG